MRPRRALAEHIVVRYARGQDPSPVHDRVAVEEPLEIHLVDRRESLTLATLLRTPGEDFELIAGFLFAESLIECGRDIQKMTYCTGQKGERDYNVVKVHLRGGIPARAREAVRPTTTHSGCGLCSKSSFDPAQMCPIEGPPPSPTSLDPDWLCQLPPQLHQAQSQFRNCGGVHAAALVPVGGQLYSLCEDAGRHNAVDKLIGKELLQSTSPLFQPDPILLLLSGRAGFELIQKAIRARITIVASLGAPTSLAVEWAKKASLVLIGFLGAERFNVYSGHERLRLTQPLY